MQPYFFKRIVAITSEYFVYQSSSWAINRSKYYIQILVLWNKIFMNNKNFESNGKFE